MRRGIGGEKAWRCLLGPKNEWENCAVPGELRKWNWDEMNGMD